MHLLATALAALLASGCAPGMSEPVPQGVPVSGSQSKAPAQSAAAVRGRMLAMRACGGCHAADAVGTSLMAGAPPLRDIATRRPLDDIEAAMAQGLVTGHPAMPRFVFRASEIDDLIAYLDALRSTQSSAMGVLPGQAEKRAAGGTAHRTLFRWPG